MSDKPKITEEELDRLLALLQAEPLPPGWKGRSGRAPNVTSINPLVMTMEYSASLLTDGKHAGMAQAPTVEATLEAFRKLVAKTFNEPSGYAGLTWREFLAKLGM